MTLVLLVATGALYWMPNTILAATIIMAAYGLWDFTILVDLWRVRKEDFLVWWVSFLATLFLGSSTGLLVALGFSIAFVVYRISRPHIATLGRLPRTTVWRDAMRFPSAMVMDGVLVLRIDSDIFFANISWIHNHIVRTIEAEPPDLPVRVLILDLSAVSDVDYSAVRELHKTFKWLKARDIRVLATAVSGPVRDMLRRSELLPLIGTENIFWMHQDASRAARAIVRSYLPDVDEEHESRLSSPTRAASASRFGGETHALRYAEQGKTKRSLFQMIV